MNAKAILNSQIAIKSAPKGNFVSSIVKTLFSGEQDKLFGSFGIEDFKRIVNLIDECINMLQDFYKVIFFSN